MTLPHRIIDANANRAREALRVMEDAARFLLDDADLCERIKSLRHELAAALALLPDSLIAHRDTPGDIGTTISTRAEMHREDMRSVVIAAGKRLSEALRSIEEYAKVIDASGDCPRRIEAARYEGYELERLLALAMGTGRCPQWKLCVILTESLCTHQAWHEVARLATEAGADCIQLREKSLDSAELLRRARSLVDLARRSPKPPSIIINDRPDIALLSGAAGVHLGQTDMSVLDARKIVGFDLFIGVSTENIAQARQALHDGADYCGVGPMYPTTTKAKPRLAGPSYLREYLAHAPPLPPHLAIGGINSSNLGELMQAGASGIAVSSAVCGAPDPGAACRELLATLRQVRAHTGQPS